MKKISILIFALIICAAARSQSYTTSVQYNENMRPAIGIELANNPEDIAATILEKLKQAGYKPVTTGHLFWKNNKIEGFYVFHNIILPSLGAQKLDLYFKVMPKTEEEKNNSTLYLLVSTGNENFGSPGNDSLLWDRAKVLMNAFIDNTIAYTLEQDIKKQENILEASQKKLSTLRKDEKDLEDRMKKISDDLMTNQSSQVAQEADVDNQKKVLEDLKLKRKT